MKLWPLNCMGVFSKLRAPYSAGDIPRALCVVGNVVEASSIFSIVHIEDDLSACACILVETIIASLGIRKFLI